MKTQNNVLLAIEAKQLLRANIKRASPKFSPTLAIAIEKCKDHPEARFVVTVRLASLEDNVLADLRELGVRIGKSVVGSAMGTLLDLLAIADHPNVISLSLEAQLNSL